MAALLARYSAAMVRNPLRTNLCTAVPLMVVGDVCAQQLEARQRGRTTGSQLAAVDPQRTLVMTSYSAGIFTPIFFYLYPVLDKYLRGPPLALALQKAFGSILIGGVPANIAFLALATTVEMKAAICPTFLSSTFSELFLGLLTIKCEPKLIGLQQGPSERGVAERGDPGEVAERLPAHQYVDWQHQHQYFFA